MSKKLFAGATALMMLAATGANAATYVSKLEYSEAGYTSSPFGTVTIEELDANNVKLTVSLPGIDKIVDTGNGHVAFAFNLSDNPNSTVTVLTPAVSSFVYAGEGAYKMSPFGQTWKNAVVCCGQGASNGEPPPLVLKISNTSGISFLGSGNHFTSNNDGSVAGFTKGWWFAVDTYDSDRPGSGTFAVAARDITCTSGCAPIPEPSTWALMIAGFGITGLAVRRRRTTFA